MKILSRLALCSGFVVLVQSRIVTAQARPEFSAGFGEGVTHETAAYPTVWELVAFASAEWRVIRPISAGVELWGAFNDDIICHVSGGSFPCRRTFPVFVGVAPTIAVGIGHAVEVGVGPGVFERYYSPDDKSLVVGAVGHLSTTVLRSRYVNALVSVRPFIGSPGSGRTAWVVPIVFGLSR